MKSINEVSEMPERRWASLFSLGRKLTAAVDVGADEPEHPKCD